MLSDYLPDHITIHRNQIVRDTLIGLLDDTAHPQPIRKTPYTAYITDRHEPAIATRSIVDSIDWDAVPDDHDLYQYCDDANDANEDSDEEWVRDLVTEYSRIRGAAAHAAYTAPSTDDSIERLHAEIADIYDVDNPDEMYEAVYHWPGSKQMPPLEIVVSAKDFVGIISPTSD